jgi:hypothetical protein
MAQLIQHLRLMIGDPATAPAPQFADDDLEIYLDRRREVIRYAIMKPEPTPTPFTGVSQYFDFYADNRFWEGDATFYHMNFSPVVPDTIDFITGHITFAVSVLPPIFIVGKYYDMNGSAADALDAWAAAVTLQVQTMEGAVRYNLEQKCQALQQMAERYRRRTAARSYSAYRGDTTEDDAWGF